MPVAPPLPSQDYVGTGTIAEVGFTPHDHLGMQPFFWEPLDSPRPSTFGRATSSGMQAIVSLTPQHMQFGCVIGRLNRTLPLTFHLRDTEATSSLDSLRLGIIASGSHELGFQDPGVISRDPGMGFATSSTAQMFIPSRRQYM